tara:strand:- start:855 stop:1238 length:384 start_codon:yes stop_codon:yes gene_type:complete
LYSASESESEEEEEEIDEVKEYKKECNIMWERVYWGVALRDEFDIPHSRVPDEDCWNYPKDYDLFSLLSPHLNQEAMDNLGFRCKANGNINKYVFDTLMYFARGWCEINNVNDIFWVVKCIIDFVGI